jgi:hypothetical protein
MDKQQDPHNDFEGRLLAQLQGVVAERAETAASIETAAETATPAWRQRGPRLALGGGVAVAALAAGLIVSAGGDNTPAAYAVETQPGGGVEIKINSLSDAGGVEAALEQAGVPSQVTYLEADKTCREPHFTPSSVEMPNLPGGTVRPFTGINLASFGNPITIGIGTAQQQHELFDERAEDFRQGETPAADPPGFIVDPTAFRPGQTLVISGSPIGPDSPYAEVLDEYPDGGTVMNVRVAEGEVQPCEPVPVSDDFTP